MFIKSLQIIAVVALATIVLIDPAFATDSGAVFKIAQSKAADSFKQIRDIIFVVGGFGLVGLAFGAIFGRVNWKWFAALAVGLLILAAAGAVVDYATKGSKGSITALSNTVS